MQAKIVITTRFPTVEETAREMGVGERRVRQLRRLMMAIVQGRDGRIVRFLTAGGTAAPRAKKKTTAKHDTAKRKRTAGR